MQRLSINQTTLKFIAVISMLIDHIGVVFFPNLLFFRIIGRLAFPIFAFLIARGFLKTRSKTKYLLRMLLFACISIYPYYLVFHTFAPNILFTFSLSFAMIWGFEAIKQSSFFRSNAWEQLLKYSILVFFVFFITLLSELFLFEYGFLGVLLPFVFYVFQDKTEQFFFFTALTTLYCVMAFLSQFDFASLLQIFSLFSIPLLAISSTLQSKRKWKWFFYVFYPLHLITLYLISLF